MIPFPFTYYIKEEAAEYGIDWDGPTFRGEDDAGDGVIVPEVPIYLDSSQLSILKTIVNPLEECDDYGRSYFVATRQLVREMLTH